MLLPLAVFAAVASASPGAYRVIVVQANCEPPATLESQLAAFPDVATVDSFDGCEGTPSAAQLNAYDLVVSESDEEYEDQEAYGNALADFVDAGGVVVQYAYDNWDQGEGPGGHNGPTGRFSAGGYEPFTPGPNSNEFVTLGSFDASSPLMEGVASLETGDNTAPTLAPGATSVAKWSDGRELVAYKSRVVSISGYTGDNALPWGGDFARLTVNAVRWLGRHTLTVANANPVGGTVTGSAGGISCGAVCSASFVFNAPVTLSALANPGFAFAGFGGACSGPSCALVMDVAKAVTANFESFALGKKVKLNKKKGTGLLTVRAGGPGALVLAGKRVKRRTAALTVAGTVKIPVVAKGKARKALKKKAKAKVGFKVFFTPTGGSTAVQAKTVKLVKRKKPRRHHRQHR
jgi:Divergent InlB B-repeat domain